jgi:hypothetical protein
MRTDRVKEPPLLNCQKINSIWDIPAVSAGANLAPQATNRPTSPRRFPVPDCRRTGLVGRLRLAAKNRTPQDRRTHPQRGQLRDPGTKSL